MEVTGLVRVGLVEMWLDRVGFTLLGERRDGKVGRDRKIGRCGVGVGGDGVKAYSDVLLLS